MVPGMPPVAATPYLVTIAEMACGRLVSICWSPGRSRSAAGSSSIISAPSKVGAELVIKTALMKRDKNRFKFAVRIEDGARTVAMVEHERAAVSMQKIMSALG